MATETQTSNENPATLDRPALLAAARAWWARKMPRSNFKSATIKGDGRVDVHWEDRDDSGTYTLPVDFADIPPVELAFGEWQWGGLLLPCPNPWCASHKRGDEELFEAHKPIVVPSVFGTDDFAVSCPVCPISGPRRATEPQAINAWNGYRVKLAIL